MAHLSYRATSRLYCTEAARTSELLPVKRIAQLKAADLRRPPMTQFPDLIPDARTSEEEFLRHIFVRDQMHEWCKNPLIMARAEGVFYWDVHGKRYFDALSGIYTVALGHNNRRVIEAAKKQLDTLHFSPPMHGTNPVAIQFANLLAELAPGDLSTVKFQSSGSEATEAAIKFARQYHRLTGNRGKYKIVSRYQSWHGSTMGAMSASGLLESVPADLLPLPLRKGLRRLRNHLRHHR
jgi:adenosylmethionine-8-amino-7-oxononanoate aminotransferase